MFDYGFNGYIYIFGVDIFWVFNEFDVIMLV